MEMEWEGWSSRLKEVLGLVASPVAVRYTDADVPGLAEGRWRVCGAIQEAARGAVVVLTAENSACPGGSQYLGLSQQPPERAKVLRKFLIEGEKLFSSPAAILRSQALSVKPPFGTAERVVFSPLEKAGGAPDIVVFICNAWQAARLINLAYYTDGKPMECDPTGALCRAVVTYPLVTGRVNVSFGDVTARRMQKYGENELFVSIPLSPLHFVMDGLDRCSAGTAKTEIPEEFRRVIGDVIVE